MRVHFIVSFDLPLHATPSQAHEYVQYAMRVGVERLLNYHPPALDPKDPKIIISNASGDPMSGLDLTSIQTIPATPK